MSIDVAALLASAKASLSQVQLEWLDAPDGHRVYSAAAALGAATSEGAV